MKARRGPVADFDLTAEITGVLKQYTGAVMDDVDQAVETCGKGMRKEIAATSPKRTKQYSKGWRCEITNNGRGNKSALVKNKTNYQLTHLLEKRHKKRGRKGYVEPQPHIGPAAEKWNQKFEQMCEEDCKAK